jgi:hypothetical protein
LFNVKGNVKNLFLFQYYNKGKNRPDRSAAPHIRPAGKPLAGGSASIMLRGRRSSVWMHGSWSVLPGSSLKVDNKYLAAHRNRFGPIQKIAV